MSVIEHWLCPACGTTLDSTGFCVICRTNMGLEANIRLSQELAGAIDALKAIAHHERAGDYAGQVNAMRAIASDALAALAGQ
jgi:hypothetical protein